MPDTHPQSSAPATASPPAALRAQDYAAVNNWSGYFQAVRGKGARETLVKALDRFDAEKLSDNQKIAVDLACGEGRDTYELLNRGWRVLAIDASAEGIHLLHSGVPAEQLPRLKTEVATFRDARWPPALLLNCSFALPFCPPADFDVLWRRIVEFIPPGGRFCGQLFGERDSWARCAHTLGHTRARMNELFAEFTLEYLNEEEKDDKDATGNPKHWHVFHIVGKKR